MAGFLEMRLRTYSGELNNVNQLGGSRGILKLRSSEIARNKDFSIHFGVFKVLKEGSQVT